MNLFLSYHPPRLCGSARDGLARSGISSQVLSVGNLNPRGEISGAFPASFRPSLRLAISAKSISFHQHRGNDIVRHLFS